MFQFFIILLAIGIANAQEPICSQTQVAYKGVCIDKTCVQQVGQAFWTQVTPKPLSFAGNPGRVYFITNKIGGGGGDIISYQQEIDFTDLPAPAQMFAPSQNCLNFKVYSVVSDTDITRRDLFTNDDGSSWPTVSYAYVPQTGGGYGQILFKVTQAELDTRQCVRIFATNTLTGNKEIVWTCYFELAINVQTFTQISIYLSFQVRVNTKFSPVSGGLVNFISATTRQACTEADSNCIVNVAVNSGLRFCTTAACTTLLTGLQTISIGSSIFMIHYIADGAFDGRIPPVGNPAFIMTGNAANTLGYQINNAVLRLTGEFSATYSEGDVGFTVITKKTGYSIYEFKALLTSNGITIFAEGVLGQANRNNRNLQEQKQYVVTTQAEFGEIVDPSAISSPSIVENSSSSSSVSETPITSSSYLLQAGCVLALCNILQ